MSISNILKERRKELGLTLLDVANKVGVSESAVQRWESGNIKNLRQDKIGKLADALSVAPAYLMGWEEDIIAKKTSSGIINVDDELNTLISRIESSHIVRYGGDDMDTKAQEMLKNSLNSLIQSLDIITR